MRFFLFLSIFKFLWSSISFGNACLQQQQAAHGKSVKINRAASPSPVGIFFSPKRFVLLVANFYVHFLFYDYWFLISTATWRSFLTMDLIERTQLA